MDSSGNAHDVKPGNAILMGPGVKHGYGGMNDYYIEDYICFCGPLADRMNRAGMIDNGIVPFGKARRLLPIIELSRDPAITSQYRANMLLQQMILDIFLESGSNFNAESNHHSISMLIKEIHNNILRWWTVAEMAEYCNMSISQFRRVFTQDVGILPKHYISQVKINHAAAMLAGKNIKITDVAEKHGFKDSFHFSKVFKAHTGVPPTDYIALLYHEK
ncbi:MAG: AraC family transcriptional regulator [Victivallaceae bacterium]